MSNFDEWFLWYKRNNFNEHRSIISLMRDAYVAGFDCSTSIREERQLKVALKEEREARLIPTIKYICGECGLLYDEVVERCHGCNFLLEVDKSNTLQQLKEAIDLLKRCYPMVYGNNMLSDVSEFIEATSYL